MSVGKKTGALLGKWVISVLKSVEIQHFSTATVSIQPGMMTLC